MTSEVRALGGFKRLVQSTVIDYLKEKYGGYTNSRDDCDDSLLYSDSSNSVWISAMSPTLHRVSYIPANPMRINACEEFITIYKHNGTRWGGELAIHYCDPKFFDILDNIIMNPELLGWS